MSRRVANRHRTVLEAFTFLFHYSTLRQEQCEGQLTWMETKYNIARAFHFLGRILDLLLLLCILIEI